MKPTKQSELDQPPSVCPRAQSNSNPPGFDKMLDFKTNLLGYFFNKKMSIWLQYFLIYAQNSFVSFPSNL